MRHIQCPNCGSVEFREDAKKRTCLYCQTSFEVELNAVSTPGSSIDIQADIDELIRKCDLDPANKRTYANLILDLDPDNEVALQLLNSR